MGQLSFKQLFILHLWQIFECFFLDLYIKLVSFVKGLVLVLQMFGALCVVGQKF